MNATKAPYFSINLRALRNFLAITLVSPEYDQRLWDTGAKLVLIEAGSVLDNFLARDARWQAAYRDAVAAVYLRAEE